MDSFYFHIKDTAELKVYSKKTVIDKIIENSKGLMFSNLDAFSDSVLANEGFIKISEVIEETLSNKDEMPYASYRIEFTCTKNLDSVPIQIIKYYLDNDKLSEAWKALRNKRDSLLKDSDWTENSKVLTTNCKSRFQAYRQLLRDCTNDVDFPHKVIIPIKPNIEYKDSDRKEEIDDDRKRQLQNITSKNGKYWKEFLVHWSKLNYTKDAKTVNLLLQLWEIK